MEDGTGSSGGAHRTLPASPSAPAPPLAASMASVSEAATAQAIAEAHRGLRATFATGRTATLAWRRAQLEGMRRMLTENTEAGSWKNLGWRGKAERMMCLQERHLHDAVVARLVVGRTSDLAILQHFNSLLGFGPFGPLSAEFGRSCPNFGQLWPDLHRQRPLSSRNSPNSTWTRLDLGNIDCVCPDSGKLPACSPRSCPARVPERRLSNVASPQTHPHLNAPWALRCCRDFPHWEGLRVQRFRGSGGQGVLSRDPSRRATPAGPPFAEIGAGRPHFATRWALDAHVRSLFPKRPALPEAMRSLPHAAHREDRPSSVLPSENVSRIRNSSQLRCCRDFPDATCLRAQKKQNK